MSLLHFSHFVQNGSHLHLRTIELLTCPFGNVTLRRMSAVNTASGTIQARQLGLTLMHEHTVIGYPGWDKDAAELRFDLSALAGIVTEKLLEAKKYGVCTVVDATPDDLGRNAELNKIISGETGLNIICSTGKYMNTDPLPFQLSSGASAEMVDVLFDTFMQDLTAGIHDTGIKAGVIKVATGNSRISPYEEAALKAAAKAQKATGVPIITHTQEGTMGPQQASLLIAEGADPQKVVIGHMCGNADLSYQLAVLDQGVSVNFDRWGLDILFPDDLRKATLIKLLKSGLAGQIVLSHDHIAHWLIRQAEVPEYIRELIVNWSYTHLFRNILPSLKQAGVTEEQINQMLVINPQKIFE